MRVYVCVGRGEKVCPQPVQVVSRRVTDELVQEVVWAVQNDRSSDDAATKRDSLLFEEAVHQWLLPFARAASVKLETEDERRQVMRREMTAGLRKKMPATPDLLLGEPGS